MRRVLLGSTALALAVSIAGTAQAQTPGNNGGANGSREKVDDKNIIVVTATRRSEDVQKIPLAVTAVSPVQLERQGVVNVQDVGSVSSSFSSSSAQTASSSIVLRIRGIGTTSNNIGFESAVGIFVDGVYQSRPGVAMSEFVDVERVEVLRGPQGTLFGRNTSAGALNITNARPDLNKFGGFANATYGNRDLMSVQGAVNVPLVKDAVAMRLTGAYRKRDGYIKILDSAGNHLGDSNNVDQYLVRGQVGWESSGGIKGRIVADYSKSDASSGVAVEILKSPVEVAGRFAAVGLGTRGGQAAPFVASNPLDLSEAQRAVNGLTATANFLPTNRVKQWGITGEIEVPLGDNADLIYIGSYRKFTAFEAYDGDATGLDAVSVNGANGNIKTMTHELRLQGEALDGRLEWLVGGYYSSEKIYMALEMELGEDYGELVGALLYGPTGGALGANPLTIFSGGVDPAGTVNTNIYGQNSKSWSVFTHNTFKITDQLGLTVGLRYSDERKSGSFEQGPNSNALCPAILNSIAAGGVPAALVNSVFGTGCFVFTTPADLPQAGVFPLPRTFNEKFKDTELIYTGKISYAFDAPVNVYASFTHGYKAGGFNLDSTASISGADPRFKSEKVNAYEVGLKAKMIDGAVMFNLAAFREDFTNFQVLEFTGTQFKTFNVPKARTSGLEIESIIRPSDNLTVNMAVTYIDANYPSDCAGTQTVINVTALCGASLTSAPALVGIAGVTYTKNLGNYLDFFVTAQARMSGDERTSTQKYNTAITTSRVLVPFDQQDGNTKINLRAGIGAQDDSWALEVFGTNITNQLTRGVTFSTALRSGSRSAYIQEPRSYGVTLRTKF